MSLWIQTYRPWSGLPQSRIWAMVFSGLLLATVLQPGFAALVDSADTAGTLAADVGLQRRAAALAGNALDKALTGAAAPGQINLDLLLDMTRSDAATVASSAGSWPALAPGPNPLVAMPLAAALLGTEASLPLSQAPRAQIAPVGGGRGDKAGSGVNPDAVRASRWRMQQLRREDLAWTVGGILLLVLLGIVIKVFDRRISADRKPQ